MHQEPQKINQNRCENLIGMIIIYKGMIAGATFKKNIAKGETSEENYIGYIKFSTTKGNPGLKKF
ncbi:UNVERIFIED_CONTAM: hypothetical protein NCL1_27300 [Trichonephila clavipes]